MESQIRHDDDWMNDKDDVSLNAAGYVDSELQQDSVEDEMNEEYVWRRSELMYTIQRAEQAAKCNTADGDEVLTWAKYNWKEKKRCLEHSIITLKSRGSIGTNAGYTFELLRT